CQSLVACRCRLVQSERLALACRPLATPISVDAAGRYPAVGHARRLVMKSMRLVTALLGLALWTLPAHAQSPGKGVERLYILNCAEGVAGVFSRWSPGVNVGKSMDFVDNCYLIRHTQGWFLWDTGVTDAIAAMPDGQRPSDPRATHWRRPKT